MATNLIQIKRTSVSGRAANSTTLTNPGELALNMTDGIMYSTNGTSVFEIGANNTNQRVTGTLTVNAISANGGVGTAGQVLSSNGTSTYWATSSTLNAQQSVYTYTLAANTTVITGADDTAATLGYVAGLENVFINGVRQISGVDYNTTNATAITLTSNAISGEVVQVVAWTGSINSTNVNAQFAWTNTHSFSNTVTLAAISANGSLGTAGHVLHSNGTATYWAADDSGTGTVTSIATANGLTGGTITTSGTLGVVTGSTLTVNTTGIHVNSNLSLADLTVSGNLTVSGTRTYVNTTTLDVGDNIITLNADLGASAPTQDAGIEIMRGTSANAQFIWDETNDRWSTNSAPFAASNTTITNFANIISSTTDGYTRIGNFGGSSFNSNTSSGGGSWGGFANSTHGAAVGYFIGLTPNFYGALGEAFFATGNTITLFLGTNRTRRLSFDGSTGAASFHDHPVSNITTLAAGNTTITGFVNATSTVNASGLAVGTSFVANTTRTTFGTPVLFNNQQQLRFQTVNTSAYAYFTQQNDDNFVFYTLNTTYGARAVLAIFANSITSNLQSLVPLQPSAGIVANSSLGSAGQVLKTTGTNIYWDTAGVISPTLQVGNTGGTVDATLHIKSVQGGNGRFMQFSPQGNSINALAIMASSNSSGGEQWWSVGSQNDDTFKIQKGVGFGGAGVSISNTGAITSADRADAFGYKGIPQNQQTSAYTLVMSDNGKHIYATAANFAITIPANSTTAFPIGAAITIVVEDQLHTIAPAAGVTLVLAGTGAATTGTRTLAQGAVATILKVGTDRWYISGAGVT